MIFAFKRIAGIANSRFHLGLYNDIYFQALTSRYEYTGNSRDVRALILVQNIVTNVPRVLLRASRRNMRCGVCDVSMPNFSETPVSIAFTWLCDAPAHDQTKIRSLYY